MQHSRGFTLVELIVVIAIIGLLATIGVSSYQNIMRNARDAKRVSDAREIRTALAAYNAQHGQYPLSVDVGGTHLWNGECDHPWGTGNLDPEDVIPGLVPDYLEEMPSDPMMNRVGTGGGTPCYLYRSNGTDFAFLIHRKHIGGDNNYSSRPELLDSHRDGGTNRCTLDGTAHWAWKIYSSGAVCW